MPEDDLENTRKKAEGFPTGNNRRRVAITFTAGMFAEIQALADKQGRSFSGQARVLCQAGLAAGKQNDRPPS